MKTCIGYLIILPLILPGLSLIFAQQEAKSDMALSSGEDAIIRMFQYTGFDKLDSYKENHKKISARLEWMDRVNIPFLWRDFAGQEIWIVTAQDIVLEDFRFEGDRKYDSLARTFTVYLDPRTGYLLRLDSKILSDDSTSYNPEPPVEIIENQLEANERFIGFPDEPIKISFVDAMSETNTSWFDAKEIIAHCVTYTTNGWRDTLNVWSIDLRGFSLDKVLGPHGHFIDECGRGHQRNIINAMTGRLQSVSSTPLIMPQEIWDKYYKKDSGK